MTLAERTYQAARLLTQLINATVPTTQFQIIADNAAAVLPADFIALCLADEEDGGYYVYGLRGKACPAMPRRAFAFAEGLAGHVFQTAAVFFTNDLANETLATSEIEDICCRFGTTAMLAAPLVHGEQRLGVLLFGADSGAGAESAAFTADDALLARLLADGLAEALANARQYQAQADEYSMLEAVLRSTRDAILLMNSQGLVLMANPAVTEMLGLAEADVVGRPLDDAPLPAPLRHLLLENQAGVVELPLDDGRTAQAQLVSVSTAYSEQVGWAAVLRDVTVFKELEQMKNDFVNTVSHDLKNPITSVLLAADLLDRAGPLNERQQQVQASIKRTGVYMSRLVGDMLDLGKIEAGLALNLAPLDLRELLDQALATLAPQIEEKGHQLQTDVPAAAPVNGDAHWLLHVLVNLVSNAVKYTPAGGHIQLSIRRAGGLRVQPETGPLDDKGLVCTIADSGIGIAAADLPYVFDKFFRSSQATAADIPGTGLGLAMTRSIIKAHNGYIWVESEEGKGSQFAFYLPPAG